MPTQSELINQSSLLAEERMAILVFMKSTIRETCREPFVQSTVLLIGLVLITHYGWIEGALAPNADFWFMSYISNYSFSDIVQFNTSFSGSSLYRALYNPTIWLFHKMFGENWSYFHWLNVALHYFSIYTLGSILRAKFGSEAVVFVAYILAAPLALAVYSFGILQFACAISVLMVLIAVRLFQRRGITIFSFLCASILINASLFLYEAPGFILCAWGLYAINKADRKKYIAAIAVIAAVYLIPNILYFPSFKSVYIKQRSLDLDSIFNFWISSFQGMLGVLLAGIENREWQIGSFIKLAISATIVWIIGTKNGFFDEYSFRKSDRSSLFTLVMMGAAIIGCFSLIFISTWFQAPYLWYVPAIGFAFLIVGIVLGLRKYLFWQKIQIPVLLTILSLSQLVVFSYQAGWKISNASKLALIEFMQRVESDIPIGSEVLLVFETPPIVRDLNIKEFGSGWTFKNIILWKYGKENFVPEVSKLYEGLRYQTMEIESDLFAMALNLKIEGKDYKHHSLDMNKLSSSYVIGYFDNKYNVIGKIKIVNSYESEVLQSIELLSTDVPDASILYFNPSKGFRVGTEFDHLSIATSPKR